MDMEEIVEPLRSLDGADDWGDIDAVQAVTRKAFVSLMDADRNSIRAVLRDLPGNSQLLDLCEHYDVLDKIVLWDDPTGFRVRLHVFLPGYFDRPHNHRWSYASTILRGRYRHHLFGDVELDEEVVGPGNLEAIMVRGADWRYLCPSPLDGAAVVSEPYTVSLVIRGPAVKDRFLVMDRKTGKSWWQYGANQESAAEAAQKRMSVEHFRKLRGQLDEWGVC
jgi:hypothetical protein